MWYIQSRDLWSIYKNKKTVRGERKGGDDRDPTLKNMSALVPAAKSRC
jgi:hypothetical protein